jgi:hypothetical protein
MTADQSFASGRAHLESLITDAQVNIYSKDPEVLASFYKSLGLREKFRFPLTGRPDQVEVAIGALTLGFTSREALSRLANLQVEPGPAQSEVVLWCGNAADLFAQATRLGARPVAAPRVFNNRIQSAWIEDPEGNRVKLVSLVNPGPAASDV